MTNLIDLDQFRYVPALRTRMWEMRGYAELPEADKGLFLPVFSLCRYNQTRDVTGVAVKLQEAVAGRPFILDLEQSAELGCGDAARLLDPANAFGAWRAFAAAQPYALPAVLTPRGAPLREVVRQALAMERSFGRVVIRSRDFAADSRAMLAILGAVEDIANVMIILDFMYVRGRWQACALDAAEAINQLRTVDPSVRIVVMGSSYPRSAATYDDAGTVLQIEERLLHRQIGGDEAAIYGDHAAIFPEPFEPMPSRFVPRIDFPLPDAWVFRRVREDRGGFIECARRITDLDDWDPELEDQVWGARKIAAAARGDVDRMQAPAPWIAVRVNLHLWRQLRYAVGVAEDGLED